MRALSIKQPWAWLICAGYKDIENRNWSINKSVLRYGGLPQRIYVHAGAKVDNDGAIQLWENKERLGIQGCINTWVEICNTWEQGAIIGEVDIVGCRFRFGEENGNLYSIWHEVGMYGFLLANPLLYDKPIPCKGKLGFFGVDLGIVATTKEG
jgi:hypothetical protein